MTRIQIAKLAAAVSLALAAGIAAADTQSLSVSASVLGTCKFNTGQMPKLVFSPIDPSGTLDATATADITYKCTKGTAATVNSSVTGSRTMNGTGTASSDSMTYTLSFTGGTGTGTGKGFGSGQDLTLSVSGTITPAEFQDKTAGDYGETVTLTVTP